MVGATNRDDKLAAYSLPLGNAEWGVAAPGGDSGAGADRKVVSSFWFGNGSSEHYAFSQGHLGRGAARRGSCRCIVGVEGVVAGRRRSNALLDSADGVACGQGCHGRVNVRKAVGAPPLPQSPTPTTRQPPLSSPPTAPPITAAVTPSPSTSDAVTTTIPLADFPFAEDAAALSVAPTVEEPADDEGLPVLLGLAGAGAVALAGAGTATVGYRNRRRTVTTRP